MASAALSYPFLIVAQLLLAAILAVATKDRSQYTPMEKTLIKQVSRPFENFFLSKVKVSNVFNFSCFLLCIIISFFLSFLFKVTPKPER